MHDGWIAPVAGFFIFYGPSPLPMRVIMLTGPIAVDGLSYTDPTTIEYPPFVEGIVCL